MAIGSELLRVVRHGVAPLVVIAVERGYLPASAQGDAIEFIAAGIAFAAAYAWSAWNDYRAKRAALDFEQQARAVGARCPGCTCGDQAVGAVEKE